MSHHFLVPTNENGLSLDSDIGLDINTALDRLGFTNIFLYSHGWWTDAIRAMQGYNRFTIEFSAEFRSRLPLANLQTLNIGIHWPSTLTEDQFSLLSYAQALSFFTMEKRADTVGENCGYALIRLVLNAMPANAGALRIRLVGHSFGCKVVCQALQTLATAADAIPSNVTFEVALLQAAFDNNELEPEKDYGSIPGIPGLRLLVTRSDGDTALGSLYPKAHTLAHLFRNVQPALGSSGPTANTVNQFGGVRSVAVGPDYDPGANALAERFVLADLSALHAAHPESNDRFAGHHSDMFRTEVYKLLAAFFFGG